MIRLFSSTSASSSESVTIYSNRAISDTIWSMAGPLPIFSLKYDLTRLCRLMAFPTYKMTSLSSRMIYTPGLRGSFFNSSSKLNPMTSPVVYHTFIIFQRYLQGCTAVFHSSQHSPKFSDQIRFLKTVHSKTWIFPSKVSVLPAYQGIQSTKKVPP